MGKKNNQGANQMLLQFIGYLDYLVAVVVGFLVVL